MNCNDIQDRLADDLSKANTHPEVAAHLESCAACRKVAERLRQVDQAMAQLPRAAIPDGLVNRTVDAVDKQALRPKSSARQILAIATPVVVILVVGTFGLMVVNKSFLEDREPASGMVLDETGDGDLLLRKGPGRDTAKLVSGSEGRRVYSIGTRTAEVSGRLSDSSTVREQNGQFGPTGGSYWEDAGAELYNLRYSQDQQPDHGVKLGKIERRVELLKKDEDRTKNRLDLLNEKIVTVELPPASTPTSQTSANKDLHERSSREADKPAIAVVDDSEGLDRNVGEDDGWRWSGKKGDKGGEGKESGVEGGDFRQEMDSKRSNRLMGERAKDNLEHSRREAGQGYLKVDTDSWARIYVDGKQTEVSEDRPIRLRQGRHRITLSKPGHQNFETTVRVQSGETIKLKTEPVKLSDLNFIPAQGYFQNTYLSGDPEIEWLRSRLSEGFYLDGRRLSLERAAAPYRQPFDAPATAGLSAYLSADRASLEAGRGPTRMTLQVGLKGSERHARRRAALNAALVVDLRQTPPEDARRILWALADSMASDQQAGDRFTLVVAGAEKPVVMTAKDFKPGAVRLSLASTLQSLEESGSRQNLRQALEAAYQAVIGEGVGDAPIGANLVLLASAAPPAGQSSELQFLAHKHAVSGVTLSTIGVGPRADREFLGALAQAGQGRRRLVTEMEPAGQVIEHELSASGKVVARAVRLRIRLAEGVKLVQVLGSRPLDAVRSERVREAEKAIDRRVAKTLGVEADRGEDEDGIQIVIPAYYAGDDHVILLDVVVPGPGKVADLQVRYKDLVNLDNSVARASLVLPAGHRPDDPLVRNVSKNLLAFRTSRDLLQAGNLLGQGAYAQAVAALDRAAVRIEHLMKQTPVLLDDPELVRDQGMLAEYRRVLGDYLVWQNDQRIRLYLSRSLVYAGKVKLPPGAGLVARR